MVRKRFIILALVIMFAILLSIASLIASTLLKTNYVKGDINMENFEITDSRKIVSENIISQGCVRDEKSAGEIANVILKSIYGDNYDRGLPLIVSFDEIKQEWLIKTQLPDNMRGGSKYLIIKKSNAEVVAIWAER